MVNRFGAVEQDNHFLKLLLNNADRVNMGVECDICFKTLSKLSNLRRHKQNVHKIQPLVKPFACSDCDFQNTALLPVKQHFLQKHGHVIVNHCCYCNKVYGDTFKYLNHIEYDHGLPTKFCTPQ